MSCRDSWQLSFQKTCGSTAVEPKVRVNQSKITNHDQRYNVRSSACVPLSLATPFGHKFLEAFHRLESIRPYCFQRGECALIQVGPHHFDQAKGGESFVLGQNPYFGAKGICPANKLCSRPSNSAPSR